MMVGVQIRKDFRFNFAVSTTKSKENGIKTFLSFFYTYRLYKQYFNKYHPKKK